MKRKRQKDAWTEATKRQLPRSSFLNLLAAADWECETQRHCTVDDAREREIDRWIDRDREIERERRTGKSPEGTQNPLHVSNTDGIPETALFSVHPCV
mmetsp:Transcript_33841/g.67046  ORF Transcript_33841/g.67046 Transcript_33841/m.67046 type:complete len:98 (-) Transcript_33841:1360-1653(-)